MRSTREECPRSISIASTKGNIDSTFLLLTALAALGTPNSSQRRMWSESVGSLQGFAP